MSGLPLVCILSLGGTISSAQAAESGLASPRFGASDLVAAVPQLESVARIEVVDVARLPSSDLSFALARRVADEVSAAVGRGAVGVVITQGTDTIEEMSFCLDVTVPEDVPVVLTGAMRHAGLPGADGPANLLAAVRVAAAPGARALGTLVVLNDEIHSARTVRKGHTTAVGAFWSPDVGPIGWLAEDTVHLRERPFPRVVVPLAPGAEITPLPLITSTFDDDGWWLAGIKATRPPGLVIEGLGGGHVPGRVFDDVIALASRIPVLLSSRTGRGAVLTSTYGGFRGSETALIEGGVIPTGTLDGLKARVLLSVLLAAGCHRERIRETLRIVGRLASRDY
ncbi:MAG TPA: asparaginase [Jatrophihabitans sp.]|nr:asparaginase [Jatrophihabitans sp.]